MMYVDCTTCQWLSYFRDHHICRITGRTVEVDLLYPEICKKYRDMGYQTLLDHSTRYWRKGTVEHLDHFPWGTITDKTCGLGDDDK